MSVIRNHTLPKSRFFQLHCNCRQTDLASTTLTQLAQRDNAKNGHYIVNVIEGHSTRSSAIAERPRCSLLKLWQKYKCEKRASNIGLCYGVDVDASSF